MKFFRFTPSLVILSGGLIYFLAMGIRQTMGLFLYPITTDLGWSRETFALAIAVQSLIYGFVQPPVGIIADKFGAGRVIAVGGLFYAAGLYLMSTVTSPLMWNLGAGVMLGVGMGAVAMTVLAGAVARAVPEQRRSLALGTVAAGGGAGHFLMIIFGQTLIAFNGWQTTLLIFSALPLLMIPLAMPLAGKKSALVQEARIKLKEALSEAARHRGYLLLMAGFFVCGFQVVFVAAHLPAYLIDNDLPPALGATALAMIGFFNIIGSYVCGYLGGIYSKKYVLSSIYLARAVLIAIFVTLPISNVSVLIFAAVIGFLWLGTVPLTSALVGQIFGVQYLSTLFGFTFLSHQMGSFLGAWLGGYLYDLTGSYNTVWYISVVLGLLAALLHLPINEAQVERLRVAGQPA
ncbi:MAG: MFS transporter [SAR324 cluster bacterium]|nr:MFS transporter [SAR324 cluster bacterium]